MCVCVCHVCVMVCVCVCPSVSVYVSVCVYVYLCGSMSVSVSLYVCITVCLFSLCCVSVYDCTCIMCVPNVCDYCRSMLWFGNENQIHTSFNSNTLIHMAWVWELDTALAPTHNTLYYILYSMTMKIEFYFIYIAYIIIIIILSCHFRSKCI